MRKILSLILIFCLAILPVWAYTEYQQGQTSTVFRGPVVFFNSTSSGAVPISSANPLPVSLPSSGSASNVNLTQYGSTAVGAANAIHVQPGTGASFTVTDGAGALNTIVDSGALTSVTTVTNLNQLAGAAVPIGPGLEATAIRVSLPTDGTGVVNVKQAIASNLNATITDGDGALNVIVDSGTTAVTNAGTFVVQENGAALTALQLIDNIVSGAGVNVTQINTESIDVGAGTEAAAIRVTLPTNGTGVVGLNAGTAIIGKVGIDQTTPGTTNLVQITDGSGAVNTIIDSGTLTTVSTVTTLTNFPDNEPFNVAQIGGGSTLVAAAATDTTGTGVQTTGPLLQFDDTSTATVTEDRFAPPRISSRRNQQIEGDVASDTAIAAKPVTVGGKAQSSNNTPVTDGDAVDDFKDTQGRTIVEPFAPAALVAQQRTTISNTSETTIVTAAGASVFADIAAVSCLNTSATATYITLKDATGGTSRWDIPCPANKLSDGIIFPVPLPQASSNNNWTATAADTVSSLIVNVEYRKRK